MTLSMYCSGRTSEEARCTGDPKHRLAIWQTQAKKDPAGKELYNN